MRPYSSAQPFLRDNSVRRRIKAYRTFASLDRGLNVGGVKEKIREPGEAERLFRLVDIDGICHSSFCGRLEARFPGRAILYTTCPGLGLAKPDKSRLFSLLTVHSRPPFPFTFCFLPPVNSDGTAGAVFCPVGFGDEHAAADRTAFQVLIPENLRFQRSVQRNHLQQTEKETVCGQVQVSPSSRAMQLPSSQQQHSRRIRLAACFFCAGVMR